MDYYKIFIYLFFSFIIFSSKVNSESIDLNSIKFEDIDGNNFYLSSIKSRLLLVVNTASYCGFTKQYAHLQSLKEKYDDEQLFIIAIPSNDFGGQEPGSNDAIKEFCDVNYNITFPIMSKQNIVGRNRHLFYKMIENNYGVEFLPKWNFYKYLFNNKRNLINSYSSHVSPLSDEIINDINLNL